MTLLEAISARHSVRKYLDKEIPADIIAALQDKIAECNKIGNLNIQLVQNETKAFTGMLSYGSFSSWQNSSPIKRLLFSHPTTNFMEN